MSEIIRIHDVRYQMEMRGGGDIWRIYGAAENHPAVPSMKEVMPTNPVVYDKEKRQFRTRSGRVYEIVSIRGDEEKFIAQLEKDIECGGFEVH